MRCDQQSSAGFWGDFLSIDADAVLKIWLRRPELLC